MDELALSPAPPKRSRHEQAPPPRRASLPPSETLPPSVTPVESELATTEYDDASPRRSERLKSPTEMRSVQVTTSRRKYKGRNGRMFQYGEDVVFVPDIEWEFTTVLNRPALLCSRYNVCCCD